MKSLKDPVLIIALLLAFFAIAPLLTHAGLPNTADGPAHLMRQVELNEAWKAGIFYPRWAPDLALGYGMPLFNYAPPWLYHTTQIFRLTGLPLDAAMKGSLILAILLYSGGMYLFCRDLFGFSPKAGLLAAAVYLYAPYHLREIFIQGNYGQLWGLAFYPFVLWTFHRLATNNRRQDIPLAAVSLAGLLLSHNISSMLFAPLFGAYLLFLLFAKFQPSSSNLRRTLLLKITIAVLLGLGLSAFFWLPAFGEKGLIRLSGITSGFFDFRHNFIALRELFTLPHRLDLSAINPYFPLSLGIPQIVFAGLAIIGAIFAGITRTIKKTFVGYTAFFGAAFFFYAFMTLPQSQWVWETVPLVALAEFPWRMLGPAIFAAAVLAGLGLRLLEQWHPKAGWWGLAIGLTITLVANLVYLVPNQFIPWGTPTPADAFAYEASSGAIGTTSTGEFLPRWTDRYPSPKMLAADYAAARLPTKISPTDLPPETSVQTLKYTARETRLAINAPAAFTADLLALYWPYWRIKLLQNGQTIKEYTPDEIEITHPDGLLRVMLPAGKYQISLQRAATPIRKTATAISIFALAVLVGVNVSGRKKSLRSPVSAEKRVGRQQGYLALSVAIVAGVIAVQIAAPLFRVQSPPDTVYGAQQNLHIDFGDQIRLLGIDPPPAVVSPGDEITVVLYWRAQQSLDTNYSVFLHLDAPNGRTIAATDQMHPSNIPTGNWYPSLYLRNPIRLRIPADALPIRYSLRTGLYNPLDGGKRLSLADSAGDTFEIGHVWVDTGKKAKIKTAAVARFGDAIHLMGVVYHPGAQTVTLYWQTDSPVSQNYSIFLHLLDRNGSLIGQNDGTPYHNLYPISAWRPGQLIEDVRPIGDTEENAPPARFAIGIYDPLTGTRLPAVDGQGNRLINDALIVEAEANIGK